MKTRTFIVINVVKDSILRNRLKSTFKSYTMESCSTVDIQTVKTIQDLDSQDIETHQTDLLMKENIMEHHTPSTKRVLFFKMQIYLFRYNTSFILCIIFLTSNKMQLESTNLVKKTRKMSMIYAATVKTDELYIHPG